MLLGLVHRIELDDRHIPLGQQRPLHFAGAEGRQVRTWRANRVAPDLMPKFVQLVEHDRMFTSLRLYQEQEAFAEHVGAQLDVDRRLELETIEVTRLGQHQARVVVERAVKLDDLCRVGRRCRDVVDARNRVTQHLLQRERPLDDPIVVGV